MEKIKPLREMAPKERLQYIWDYYKLTILIVAVTALVVGGFLYNYFSYREPVLELMMVNQHLYDMTEVEASFDGFLTDNGYDPKKNSVMMNATINLDIGSEDGYGDLMTMQTLIATRTYTGFFADDSVFAFYSPSGYFRDLSSLLTDDELAALSDRLIYGRTEAEAAPYPCGIRLDRSNCGWLAQTGYESCCFGIFYGGAEDGLAAALIRYIVF